MILTEKEAKTRWCPEARMLPNAPGYGAGNRFAEDPHPIFMAETRCIGSACMAWRWLAESRGFSSTRGYCGKAGEP